MSTSFSSNADLVFDVVPPIASFLDDEDDEEDDDDVLPPPPVPPPALLLLPLLTFSANFRLILSSNADTSAALIDTAGMID